MLALAGNLDAFIVYLALFPRGEKELEMILHDSVVRPTTGPNSTAHTGTWLQAFYLNLLWRNAVVIDNVLLRDYTSTLQASSTWSPPYRYAQMAALRAVYEGSPDALQLIHEAWNSVETPWEGEEHEDMLIRTELAGSEIAVLTQIHLGDEAGLNRDVAYGLRSHQRYYERTEDLQDDPNGWISLPLLGLCALAKWRGMTITVQSPFLPLDLI
ncbi:immunity 49 family protein [Deinococcus seoulensis]|nr:immunity 49 family protein [Deinococcus seoulensis]